MHIEYLCVAVLLVVHIAKVEVDVEHGFSRFKAVILDKLARHANPCAVIECADLCLVICCELL